jgi:D-glycero-alpha-D-manno-heptose-7-phosphate kinase
VFGIVLKFCDKIVMNAMRGGHQHCHECGKILSENWKIKKSLSKKITNSKINDLYNTLVNNGVYGAKLLGAGGGGFFLCIADPKKILQIEKKLTKLKIIKFNFENKGLNILNI